MSQMDLFAEPPRPQPADLPPMSMARNGGRPVLCYRNPNQPLQTWTGRGKPPRWITEWVEGGKSLEALRVPGTKS